MKHNISNLTFLLVLTGICILTMLSLINNIEQNVLYMYRTELQPNH